MDHPIMARVKVGTSTDTMYEAVWFMDFAYSEDILAFERWLLDQS